MDGNRSVTARFTITPPVPPVLKNLSTRLIDLKGCGAPTYNPAVASFEISFDYRDPNGDVSAAAALVTYGWTFPAGGAGSFIATNATYSGTPYDGTIRFGLCIPFGTAPSITHRITVRDGAGLTSAVLTATLTKPVGAAGAGASITGN
jgi:hypothetical protein